MKTLIRHHNQFSCRFPTTYLYLTCLTMYALTWVIPAGYGVIDYLVISSTTMVIYAAAIHVSHLRVARYVAGVQVLMLIVILLTMVDGFARYIGFWYENFALITNILSMVELIVLIVGIPWANVSQGLYRIIFNGHLDSRDFDILNDRCQVSLDED